MAGPADEGGGDGRLAQRLRTLLRQAAANEVRLRRFQEQELRLLEVTAPYELLLMIVHDTRLRFGLDAVTMLLLDPERELRQLLRGAGSVAAIGAVRFTERAEALEALFPGRPWRPRLGPFDPALHGPLFPGSAPASLAVLPLVRQGRLVGTLHFGSNDPGRYPPGYATEFLTHFAAVVAVCLENAFNQERLRRAGFTDPLTGVHNRRYFEQRLAEEVERAHRAAAPLACAFVDVDRFKAINDCWGHDVGDDVLRGVARAIEGGLRACDVLARYGGEEFTVLLPGSGLEEARRVGERIREAVAAHPFRHADAGTVPVTVSVGVAAVRGPFAAQDRDAVGRALARAADQALLQAKTGGRNRVVVAPGEAV